MKRDYLWDIFPWVAALAILIILWLTTPAKCQRLEDLFRDNPDMYNFTKSLREDQQDRELQEYQRQQIELQREQNRILERQRYNPICPDEMNRHRFGPQ